MHYGPRGEDDLDILTHSHRTLSDNERLFALKPAEKSALGALSPRGSGAGGEGGGATSAGTVAARSLSGSGRNTSLFHSGRARNLYQRTTQGSRIELEQKRAYELTPRPGSAGFPAGGLFGVEDPGLGANFFERAFTPPKFIRRMTTPPKFIRTFESRALGGAVTKIWRVSATTAVGAGSGALTGLLVGGPAGMVAGAILGGGYGLGKGIYGQVNDQPMGRNIYQTLLPSAALGLIGGTGALIAAHNAPAAAAVNTAPGAGATPTGFANASAFSYSAGTAAPAAVPTGSLSLMAPAGAPAVAAPAAAEPIATAATFGAGTAAAPAVASTSLLPPAGSGALMAAPMAAPSTPIVAPILKTALETGLTAGLIKMMAPGSAPQQGGGGQGPVELGPQPGYGFQPGSQPQVVTIPAGSAGGAAADDSGPSPIEAAMSAPAKVVLSGIAVTGAVYFLRRRKRR